LAGVINATRSSPRLNLLVNFQVVNILSVAELDGKIRLKGQYHKKRRIIQK
jgi:hypothetical protein